MLYLSVGVSGSGKTTFIKKRQESENFIYLSSDFCRGVLGKSESDQSVSKDVFNWLKISTHYFLKQGYTIFVDATFYKKESRKDFISIARKLNKRIVCYYFDIPLDICKERNLKRERFVPDHVIEKQYNNLQIPQNDEVDVLFIVDKEGKEKYAKTVEITHYKSQ